MARKYTGPEIRQVVLADGMHLSWWERDGAPLIYVSPEEVTEWQIVEADRKSGGRARAGKEAKKNTPEGKAAKAA